MTRQQLERLDTLCAQLVILGASEHAERNSKPLIANNTSEQEKTHSEAVRRRMLEMGDIINTIGDRDLRELFRRRYLHRQSWAQVAQEMQRYSGEPAAAARRMSRARKRCMVKNKEL